MFPNTGLSEKEVCRKVLLVCGEDLADVLAAVDELGISRRDIQHYREFHTFELEEGDFSATLCVTGLGSASVEVALTELYHCGARCFINAGTCGSISDTFATGDLILVEKAIRRDGASYHYRPDSTDVGAVPEYVEESGHTLDGNGIRFRKGTIISTDTFYCMGAAFDDRGEVMYPGIPLREEFDPPPGFTELKEMIDAKMPYLIDMEAATFYSLCSLAEERLFYIVLKCVANRVPFAGGEQLLNTSNCVKISLRAAYSVLKDLKN